MIQSLITALKIVGDKILFLLLHNYKNILFFLDAKILDKISFKQMDMTSNYPWSGPSKVKPDYYPLFQEIMFENYLDNNIWHYQQVKERCLETDKLIDKIIEATK